MTIHIVYVNDIITIKDDYKGLEDFKKLLAKEFEIRFELNWVEPKLASKLFKICSFEGNSGSTRV